MSRVKGETRSSEGPEVVIEHGSSFVFEGFDDVSLTSRSVCAYLYLK